MERGKIVKVGQNILAPFHHPLFGSGGSATHRCYEVSQLTIDLGYCQASDNCSGFLTQDLLLV